MSSFIAPDTGASLARPAPIRPEALVDELLASLGDSYRQRYGEAIFDVRWQRGEAGDLVLEGRVLLESQREETRRRVEEALGAPVRDAIRVLADPDVAPMAWALPARPCIDLLRIPDGSVEDHLSTQALREDPPLRVLVERGDHVLVQAWDLTLGWTRRGDLEAWPGGDALWAALVRARVGEIVAVAQPVEILLEAVEPLLGIPYRLGGADPARGLDCSALVQRLYWRQLGLVVPKHTGDQRRLGVRAARAEIRPGDLLFFKHRERGFGHVALALEDEGRVVLHAARGNGDVRRESLEGVQAAYAYLGARRVVRFARSAGTSPEATACRSEAEPRAAGPVDLSRPDSLRGANIHVVGVAGAEGAAIVRFLAQHGVTTVTAHDFSTPELFEKNFRLSHVGLKPRERRDRLRELLDLPIAFCYRDRYLEGVEDARVIFLPQGWFLYDTNARVRAQRGRPDIVFSQMTDLYFRLAPCPIAAVTGTNGKSTTTRLLADLVEASETPLLFAGNDRRNVQVLDRIEAFSPQGLLVLEVSNRQLIDLDPRPHVAVVTNVTPDHVEEHGSFEAYCAVKRKLVVGQQEDDFAVLNREDPVVASFAGVTRARVLWFGLDGLPRDGADGGGVVDGRLVLRWQGRELDLVGRDELQVPGGHNTANVLAASLAALASGVDLATIRSVVRAFRGIGLRLEPVTEKGGVRFVNDIKATTPEAALAAILAFARPLVLIVGGGDKGLDYARFCEAMAGRVHHLLVLDSPGGGRILEALSAARATGTGPWPEVENCHDLAEAVRGAARAARAGDVVLLSPACPGMFSMYMDDSQGFSALVRALPEA